MPFFFQISTSHRISLLYFPKLKHHSLFPRHFFQNRFFSIAISRYSSLLKAPVPILHHESSNAATDSPSGILGAVFNSVCKSYDEGDKSLRSLHVDLSIEQAVAVVVLLADREGSVSALGFFHWAIIRRPFRHSMRFYIATAESLVARGNFEKAQEVMRCMVECFAEIGRLKEGSDMVFEMQNGGLPLSIHTMNRILRIAADSGLGGTCWRS